MKGNNTLKLCPAAVMEALQYHFDNVVFKTSVKVKGVTENKTDGLFVVSIENSEQSNKMPAK